MNVGADWQGTAFLLMPARARFDSRFIAKINFECVLFCIGALVCPTAACRLL
jgi:hypothetical protein